MSGAIPPLYHYVFLAWCLVKHRGNFTFTLCKEHVYESVVFLDSSWNGMTVCPLNYYLFHVACKVLMNFVSYITSISRMIMNDEFRKRWKLSVVAFFMLCNITDYCDSPSMR